MSDEQQRPRVLPQSELDLALMTTNSMWGQEDVPPGLKARLERVYQTTNEAGQTQQFTQSLWGLLGFYTRDMRLANLGEWNGEIEYCKTFLDLANDFLQCNQTEPFLICLSRVATVLELSQSKGGFLRKKMNTFTQENITKDEPPKKSLFGGRKKEGY